MPHDEPQDGVTTQDRNPMVSTMQIIAFAMIVGVAGFAVVCLAVTWAKPPSAQPLFSYIATGVAALLFVMRFVVPGVVTRTQIQQSLTPEKLSRIDDDEKRRFLYGAYQAGLTIEYAMLEGAAFFCLVAYMIEASQIPLAAAGVLWVSMLLTFPTKARVDDWVQDQFQLLSL